MNITVSEKTYNAIQISIHVKGQLTKLVNPGPVRASLNRLQESLYACCTPTEFRLCLLSQGLDNNNVPNRMGTCPFHNDTNPCRLMQVDEGQPLLQIFIVGQTIPTLTNCQDTPVRKPDRPLVNVHGPYLPY